MIFYKFNLICCIFIFQYGARDFAAPSKSSAYISTIPTNLPDFEKLRMHRSCLVIAILIGIEQIRCMRQEANCYKDLMHINTQSGPKLSKAIKTIYRLYSWAISNSGPLNWLGPHNLETTAHLLDQLNAQVHILYLDPKTRHLESYPEIIDRQREQIFLLSTNGETQSHVDLITRPKSFFSKHGEYCADCGRTASMSGSYRHVCAKKGAQCEACRKPFLQESYRIHPDMGPSYCKNLILPEETVSPCKKCNKTFKNKQCKAGHTAAVCRRGWTCPECNKNVSLKNGNDEAKTRHVCNSVKCNFCHCFKDPNKNHTCLLQKTINQKNHPNIGFLSVAYSSMKDMFGKETYLQPIMCVLYAEESARATFDGNTFYDKETCLDPIVMEPYTPEDLINSCKYNNRGRKVSYNNELKPPSEGFHFPMNHNVCMTKLFKHILVRKQEQYRNMTILVPTAKDLVPISSTAALIGHCNPDILNKGGNLMSVYIPCMNLTFLSLKNYKTLDMDSLRKRFWVKGEPLYFPTGLFHLKFHSYEGRPPKPDYYYSFGDSATLKAQKKKFSDTFAIDYKWNFWFELERFLIFECKCIIKTGIQYLNEILALEKQCKKKAHGEIVLAGKEANYFHPFTKNTPGNSSAIYYIFRRYFMQHHEIYSVKFENTGVPVNNASRTELEWTSYLHHKNSNIQTAFSEAHGLPDFYGYSTPDAYDPKAKVAYFFHGCLVNYTSDMPYIGCSMLILMLFLVSWTFTKYLHYQQKQGPRL